MGGYRVESGYTMAQMAGSFDLAAGGWQGLASRFGDLTMDTFALGILGERADIVTVYNAAKTDMVARFEEGRTNLDLAGDALYEVRAKYDYVEAESARGFGEIEGEKEYHAARPVADGR